MGYIDRLEKIVHVTSLFSYYKKKKKNKSQFALE